MTPSAIKPDLTPFLLFLAAMLLTACGTPQPAQRDRFYSLDPQVPPAGATGTPLRATLLVKDLAARGFLGGRQIVFRTQDRPLEVQRYSLLLWEEPPGRAIARNLAGSLQTAGLFEFVTTPAQRSRTDYILGGALDRFEHLPTANPPHVLADFNIMVMGGANRRSLFSHRYRGQEPTHGDTPEAMTQAFNRLAGRLIQDAVRDIESQRSRLRGLTSR